MPRNKRVAKTTVPSVRNYDNPVTDRQERFALEYVIDYDRNRAVRAAGYTCETDADCASMACKLLKNPKVNAIVLQAKAKVAERMGLNAERTVQYLLVVFMEAMKANDFGSAVSALRELGKHHGIYDAHNKQKKYTREDADRLKRELEQNGFSFERVNYPGTN